MTRIIVQDDDNGSVVHELSGDVVTIGRELDNDVVIANASVSRHHAKVTLNHGEEPILRDLNSANGSTVNGEPVTESPLKRGDIVHFGIVQAIFITEPTVVAPESRNEANQGSDSLRSESVQPIAVKEPAVVSVKLTDQPSVVSFDSTRLRFLIGGAVLLVAAVAVAVFLSHRLQKEEVKHPVLSAAAGDQRLKATKVYWDQVRSIELSGTQAARNFSFDQYPRLPSGMYDFQQINNEALEGLVDTLSKRAQHLAHVSQDFASLDKLDVDPDLVAYSKELCAEWEGAASLDFNAANLVWAVHERRIRFPTADASTLGLFDASGQENHVEHENQENRDHIAKMQMDWLSQRDQFLTLGARIEAKEKEINSLLSIRYKADFK